MKESLDESSRIELVKFRLQRADMAIAEAENAASGNFFNAAVNRLYYACYYAASALLLSNNLVASTHSGVKTMLNLHFIATGRLSRDCGKTFSILMECRQSGDYDDFVFYDGDDYYRLRPKVTDFITAIRDIIEQ